MTPLLLIFVAQLSSSLLSTLTLYAAIGASGPRYVATAAVSDAVKLGVIAGVSVQAVAGNWYGIAAAVAGGCVGNAIAYAARKHKI